MAGTELKRIRGPRSLLGLTSAYSFRHNPLRFLQHLAVRYSDIAQFRLGPMKAVLINEPDLIREILVKQIENFPRLGRQIKTIRSIDGNSLFSQSGPQWVADRQLIQSAMQGEKLNAFGNDMLQHTNRTLERWRQAGTINLNDETTDLAILISAQTMLGIDLSDDREQIRKHRQTMLDRSDVFVTEMSAAFRIPDHWPLPGKRKKRAVIEAVDELIYGAIESRRANLANGESGHDFLSVLLENQAKTGMPDRQIRDHANLLFQAALDDMATAILWMLYLLAGHTAIQQKARDEISTLVGSRSIQPADWTALKYVQQIVNETLRLYPSTWLFTARRSMGDNRVGDYLIPHRSWVFLSPYVTQRDGRFFDHPDDFDPERFAAERWGKQQQSAYFPFGMGARACAGNRFSVMQLTLIAASVLQQFELRMPDNHRLVHPVPKVTIRPDHEIHLQVSAR